MALADHCIYRITQNNEKGLVLKLFYLIDYALVVNVYFLERTQLKLSL